MKDRYKQAQTDVSKIFATPNDIVAAADLSETQKIGLLHQWELDLRQLLVAADENMTGAGQGAAGERLRRVHAALAQLGVEADPDRGAPTSAG